MDFSEELPFGVDGECGIGEAIFWIRWERRGVAESESICTGYNMRVVMLDASRRFYNC